MNKVLRILVAQLNEACQRKQIRINAEKTKNSCLRGGEKVELNGVILEQVNAFI